jgi:signal transduction histidine kinase
MSNLDSPERLFSSVALERRIAELTILYQVSRALQKTVDEERALYIVLLGVTSGRGLGFNRAFILLTDSDTQCLQGRLAIGPSSADEAASIWQELRDEHRTLTELFSSLDKSSIKKDLRVNEIVDHFRLPLTDENNSLVRIMKSREACRAKDGVFDPHGLPVEECLTELLGVDSFAVAPLYLADRELGVLIADNAITHSPIDLTNLRLLQIYAQAASSAIQNTRLYRELMERIVLGEQVNLTLRESQHHLLRAERLSTIGKMAALLAHEIRTPLASIGGFARRMLRSAPPEDPRREEMEIIVSEVRRLEKLVDEVLGYSRISKSEFKSTDINGLIRSVMITMQEELQKGSIRLALDLDSRLPTAEADEAQLRQALMNLVSNAIEAMPSGGTLTLTTSFDEKYCEVGVTDTGVGINKEHWDKLFTPFFTTKTTGTGLGLAIVSQVINNHGGSLRFESIPMKGTSFHIRLALHPEHSLPTGALPNGNSLS